MRGGDYIRTNFMTFTSSQTLLWSSNKGGWKRQGMWHARERKKVTEDRRVEIPEIRITIGSPTQ